MIVTIEQFLRQIHELQLIPLPVLKSTLTPSQRNSNTPGEVAEILIREGALTRFQVDRLLKGNGQKLILGAYVIEDLLGYGGIGRVYRARHRMMLRDVAIKVLSRKVLTKRSARLRFQREMQVAARLTHPNLVMSFDAGEQEGEPYLVMEFIPGPNLRDLVKQQGPLNVCRTIDVLIQVSRGLEYAHSQGIIHRDIKPANLMIDDEGTAKVLDLGLAQHLSRAEVNSVKRPDKAAGIVGTPDYMSPEQSRDHRQIDERSDIYSLGCTLFYLLTGRPLFEADSALEKIYAHRNQDAPSLSEFREDVPPELEKIYRRMTAKDRDVRFSSATALRQALEDIEVAEAEMKNRIKTPETEPLLNSTRDIRDSSRLQPQLNWPVLLISMVTVLIVLLVFNWHPESPQVTDDVLSDASANAPSTNPETILIPSNDSPADLGFALEFDGSAKVILPNYVFEDEHVLIVELDVTPLLSDRSVTRSVFAHGNLEHGFRLQIDHEFWNLRLHEREFPLVQLNSSDPIRWGELSHLLIVVHPGYAGLYLDDQLQAEWEGVGNFLPAQGTMIVGNSDSTTGFVGKIQRIKLSKVEHLLVDPSGRRLLPESSRIVAEYAFAEGEGTLLGDTSGAERHGTIEGAVWSFSD